MEKSKFGILALGTSDRQEYSQRENSHSSTSLRVFSISLLSHSNSSLFNLHVFPSRKYGRNTETSLLLLQRNQQMRMIGLKICSNLCTIYCHGISLITFPGSRLEDKLIKLFTTQSFTHGFKFCTPREVFRFSTNYFTTAVEKEIISCVTPLAGKEKETLARIRTADSY